MYRTHVGLTWTSHLRIDRATLFLPVYRSLIQRGFLAATENDHHFDTTTTTVIDGNAFPSNNGDNGLGDNSPVLSGNAFPGNDAVLSGNTFPDHDAAVVFGTEAPSAESAVVEESGEQSGGSNSDLDGTITSTGSGGSGDDDGSSSSGGIGTVGTAVAAAVGGALVLAAAVVVGRRRQKRLNQADPDGGATAMEDEAVPQETRAV